MLIFVAKYDWKCGYDGCDGTIFLKIGNVALIGEIASEAVCLKCNAKTWFNNDDDKRIVKLRITKKVQELLTCIYT